MGFFGLALIWLGAFVFGVVCGFILRGTYDNGELDMLRERVDVLYSELRAAQHRIHDLTDRDRRGRFVKKPKDTGNE